MPWKSLIIDDDPVVCTLLAAYCERVDAVGAVRTIHSGAEALAAVQAEHFDLVFLDLGLPEVNGRELLAQMPANIPVVMVTSDPGFALESYSYHVLGYLVKPVSFADFDKCMQRVSQMLGTAGSLLVKDGSRQVKIELNELRFVKSDSNYVTFQLAGRKVMSLMRISDLEKQLPSAFMRVHRSYIVNTQFVESVATTALTVAGQQIPVSESYRSAVQQRLRLL